MQPAPKKSHAKPAVAETKALVGQSTPAPAPPQGWNFSESMGWFAVLLFYFGALVFAGYCWWSSSFYSNSGETGWRASSLLYEDECNPGFRPNWRLGGFLLPVGIMLTPALWTWGPPFAWLWGVLTFFVGVFWSIAVFSWDAP